jgi:hypothetical protein
VLLGAEAPGRQGVKSQEYLDISRFCTGSRMGCIGVQNGKLFLSKPLRPRLTAAKPAMTTSRNRSPATVRRLKLPRMELLAEEFNLLLDNTIFLYPLFNAIDGVQNSRVVAVETAADGLKR